MEITPRIRRTAPLGLVALTIVIAQACGSKVTDDATATASGSGGGGGGGGGSGDAGAPVQCDVAVDGDPCKTPGESCENGSVNCPYDAVCNSDHKWSVTCNPDPGDPCFGACGI